MFDVQYLDYFLPEEKLSIDDFVNQLDQEALPSMFPGKSDYQMFVKEILEQQFIRVAPKDSPFDMVNNLLHTAFHTSGIDKNEVDLIITCLEEQNNNESLAKQLQQEHGMTQANVLNIAGNHCANVPIIWDLVNSLSDKINNVLVVAVNKTVNMNDRVLGAYGILNDGAGIMLLSRKPGVCTLRELVKLSNGDLFKVDMNKDYSLLHFKYITTSLKQLEEKSGLSMKEAKTILPQNANLILLSKVAMGYKLDPRTIYSENIARSGHVDSVDFIINLKDVLYHESRQKGEYILALNMGWAGSYVASLITVN